MGKSLLFVVFIATIVINANYALAQSSFQLVEGKPYELSVDFRGKAKDLKAKGTESVDGMILMVNCSPQLNMRKDKNGVFVPYNQNLELVFRDGEKSIIGQTAGPLNCHQSAVVFMIEMKRSLEQLEQEKLLLTLTLDDGKAEIRTIAFYPATKK